MSVLGKIFVVPCTVLGQNFVVSCKICKRFSKLNFSAEEDYQFHVSS